MKTIESKFTPATIENEKPQNRHDYRTRRIIGAAGIVGAGIGAGYAFGHMLDAARSNEVVDTIYVSIGENSQGDIAELQDEIVEAGFDPNQYETVYAGQNLENFDLNNDRIVTVELLQNQLGNQALRIVPEITGDN